MEWTNDEVFGDGYLCYDEEPEWCTMQAEQVCDAKQWDANATKVAVGYTGLVA